MKEYLTPTLIEFFNQKRAVKILKSFTYKYLKGNIEIHNIKTH